MIDTTDPLAILRIQACVVYLDGFFHLQWCKILPDILFVWTLRVVESSYAKHYDAPSGLSLLLVLLVEDQPLSRPFERRRDEGSLESCLEAVDPFSKCFRLRIYLL